MKKSLRRWTKRALKGLIALTAALALLVWFALGTEPGAHLTLRLAVPRLPVDIEFGDVAGSLVGPLELRDVSFATGPLQIGAERLNLAWHPFEFIRHGRLHFDQVRVAGFQGTIRTSVPDAATASVPTDTGGPAVSDTAGVRLPFQVIIDDLQLEGDAFTLTDDVGVRDIRLSASGTLDAYAAQLGAVLEAPVTQEAAVEISGVGSMNEFRLENVSADLLEGEVRGAGSLKWLPEVEWQVEFVADELEPSRVVPKPEEWPGQVSLSGSMSGSAKSGELILQASLDTLFGSMRGQPIAGVVSVAMRNSHYTIDGLDIDWGRVRVNVDGVVGDDRLDLAFDIDAPDLGEVLPRASGTIRAIGRLGGTTKTPVIVADATARDVSVGQIKLGSADARVDVDWVSGQGNEALVSALGIEVAGQNIDSLRVQVTGARDSHELAADIWSGEADVSLSAVGGIPEWVWTGELADLSIDGSEYGTWRIARPAALSVSENAVTIGVLCLVEAAAEVCLDGDWVGDSGWEASASLTDFPLSALQTLLPEAWSVSGAVSGELSASATRDLPERLRVDLTPSDGELTYALGDSVHALRYREARIFVSADPDSLRGQASFSIAEVGTGLFGSFEIDATLPPLDALPEALSLSPDSESGWRATAALTDFSLAPLEVVLPEGWSMHGTVSGELSALATTGRPRRLAIDLYPSDGDLMYALGDSVHTVRYREGHIAVRANPDSLWGQIDLQVGEAFGDDYGALSIHANLPPLRALRSEVSAEGWAETLDDEWLLEASLRETPLALTRPFLPSGMALSGVLNGEVDASVAPDGSLAGHLRLQSQDAAVHRLVGRVVRTVRIVDSRMSGQAGPDGLGGELTLTFAGSDSASLATITGSVALPQYVNLHQQFGEQALESSIHGQLDLSLLDAVVEGVSGSIGQLDADIEVGGTVNEPITSGHYVVTGQTDVPSLGLALRDIEIRATGGAEGDFEVEGGVRSGSGRLAIRGRSPPIPSSESPTRITVRGTDFLAVRTDEVTLRVSPNLEVLFTGDEAIVNGELTVPRARIEILEVPETAVPVSEDVVFVGDTLVEQRRPLDVSANIRLVLGEEVTFKGFGFSSHLDGTIVMTETPVQGTRGSGELVFREGFYRGYGQNLSIDPGRLVFAGPIDDPTLDVRAYRRADDGTRAGFLVRGTLQSPEVEVWSDPPRPQNEALSYILFGRSLEQGTETDRARAGSEAAVIGGNILAMSMATKVGLDDARIETGNRREDAAFYAGKYLSPKLYVAYGVGLYEPVNVLRVRYILSRKLSVQAETGSRDSGDLLYRIEF